MKIMFTLFVVMLILKLAHVVDWSWWIITLPITLAVGGWFLLDFAVTAYLRSAAAGGDLRAMYQLTMRGDRK